MNYIYYQIAIVLCSSIIFNWSNDVGITHFSFVEINVFVLLFYSDWEFTYSEHWGNCDLRRVISYNKSSASLLSLVSRNHSRNVFTSCKPFFPSIRNHRSTCNRLKIIRFMCQLGEWSFIISYVFVIRIQFIKDFRFCTKREIFNAFNVQKHNLF